MRSKRLLPHVPAKGDRAHLMAKSASARPREVPADISVPRALLLLSTFALLLIGLLMVYSASFVEAIHEGEDATSYMVKQVVFALVGMAAAAFVWKKLPARVWSGTFSYIIWGLAALLIVMTALFGTGDEEWGARRWLYLGSFGLQPSEFAKIAIVLSAARILVAFNEGDLTVKDVAVQGVVMVLAPIGMILVAQSDLGTAAICVIGVLAVMWLGRVPKTVMIGTIVVIVALGLIFIFGVSYRASRFVYLDPWNDGEEGYGAGYAIIHSYYAFSEGGIFGVGLGNSREKYLYLPEAETDFIFAVIGEELGMIGALVVIGLFLLILYAGLRIARSAASPLSTLIAGSVTVMLVFQAFLNIGCVIGVFPTTGKPLPFISSGGSSLLASLLMIGLILSVSEEAGEPSVYDRRRADLRVVRADRARSDPRGDSEASWRAHVVGGTAFSGRQAFANQGATAIRSMGASRSARTPLGARMRGR